VLTVKSIDSSESSGTFAMSNVSECIETSGSNDLDSATRADYTPTIVRDMNMIVLSEVAQRIIKMNSINYLNS
jgi:hypothetical protein